MTQQEEIDCRNNDKNNCKGLCDECIYNGDLIPLFRFLLFIWLWKIGKKRRIELVKEQEG